jgi:hypothetical protein
MAISTFETLSSWGSSLNFFAFKEGMLGTPISVLGGWPTVSGGFLRQVFITTRTLPLFLPENVGAWSGAPR